MNALSYITSQAWAIQPESLQQLMAIMARESSDIELARAIREQHAARFDAVTTKAGAKLDGTRTARQRNGVAIIPVTGPISRYADAFTEVSGGATIETLAADFAAAMADPSVKAIVLDVNSPGGEITGVAAFAAQVYAARGVKPVTAYVDGLGASAAYWIASAAEQVMVDTTAIVGSIGVVQAVPDPAAKSSRQIEIVSSQSPNKRPDVTTETGKATIQATVDTLADLFIADVAKYRGVSAETVVQDFGRGGVLIGQQAVDAGMADSVDSIERVIERLAQPQRAAQMGTTKGDSTMDWKNVFGGLFAAAKEAEAAEATDAPAPTVTLEAAAAADSEVARLQAELEALRAAHAAKAEADAKAAAVAFADGLVAAGKIAPAGAAAFEALYASHAAAGTLDALRAAADVMATPLASVAGERVANVDLKPLALDRTPLDKTAAQAEAQAKAYTGK